MEKARTLQVIGEWLRSLDKETREVVMASFGFDGPPRSTRYIARELGISPEYVQRVESFALRMLELPE